MKKPAIIAGLVSLLLLLTRPTVGAPPVPPVGTWAQIPHTAIRPVMPPETELGNPQSVFAYSGGDLATINGRFRLVPGTDTVVLAGTVDTDVFIGQLPARGDVTPTPTPTPPARGQFLGVTGEDKVGQGDQTTGNGTPDWHLRLVNIKSDPVSVQIDAAGTIPPGRWAIPFNRVNWIIAKTFAAGQLDLWFEPYQRPTGFTVKVTYADGATDTIAGIPVTGPVAGPSSPPAPVPTPTPAPVPPPPSDAQPSPGTVWVKPGDSIPLRQWVERPGPYVRSPVCNTSGIWNVELCKGFPPSKHARMFYHRPSKSMVIAGGDRPVAMPHPGYYDGTGSEIIALNVETDTLKILRPFCVPGEPQPERPDTPSWAYDSKRDRGLMAPGYYFVAYGTGCGAIDGWGGYAFDFKTGKFTGPDAAAGLPPPPAGGGGATWGGDGGASFAVYDPVNDEMIRLRTGPRMERLNLATGTWRLTEPLTSDVPYARWNPGTNRAQSVIDVQGRAVYWLDVWTEYAPDGKTQTGQGHLAKTSLSDGSTKRARLPSQWVPVEGGGNDMYLAFDPINRIVLIPNSFNMGISGLSGLGIYHVDTGVWEWEAVPGAVVGSAWGFDENLGVLVGIGKRAIPTAYYFWKYGPKP